MPDPNQIEEIEEPWIKATILPPDEYLGSILQALPGSPRRAKRADLCRLPSHAEYRLPFNEVVFDFYDRLKIDLPRLCLVRLSARRVQQADLVKMQILVNNEPVDALAMWSTEPSRAARPRHLRAAERTHFARHVQDRGPGRDRRQGHRPRDCRAFERT